MDAYYNSQTEADLAFYSSYFGLPARSVASGCLTIVSQTGVPCSVANACVPTPSSPPTLQTWAVETYLDLEVIHALAPNAHILLVTANSNGGLDLYAAVQYAYSNGADLVSNSWGSEEYNGETTYDASTFAPSPVPLLFSSGDTGGAVQFPCTSANVVCVGGTHLQTTAAAIRSPESAWSGSGGGCSVYEPVLSYQATFTSSTCTTARAVPDVAADADPNTGLFVALGSFAAQNGSPGDYFAAVAGGTSLAAPATAAIVGLVDADRVFQSKHKLTNAEMGSYVYRAAGGAAYHARFFDVTMGSSGFPSNSRMGSSHRSRCDTRTRIGGVSLYIALMDETRAMLLAR